MTLDKLYKQAVLDHNREPQNYYLMTDASHVALGNNALCGDEIRVFLALNDAGLIERASFQGEACAIATAAASLMTSWLIGRPNWQARTAVIAFDRMLKGGDIDTALLGENILLESVKDFPGRIPSAQLCWHAMCAALDGVAEISTEESI